MKMVSQFSSKTSEVASAINSLLHFEEEDKASLLDVIHDYFTLPSRSSFEDSNDSDIEVDDAGKYRQTMIQS